MNLYKLEAGTAIRFNLDHYPGTLQFTADQLKRIHSQIAQFCKEKSEISRSMDLLCTIPGIGRNSVLPATVVYKNGLSRSVPSLLG